MDKQSIGDCRLVVSEGFLPSEEILRDTPNASFVESEVPVVVPYPRFDTHQPENALMTTSAFHTNRSDFTVSEQVANV